MSEARIVGPTISAEAIAADPVAGTQAVVQLAGQVPPPPQDDITVVGVLGAIAGVLIGGKVVHVARNLPGIQGIALRLGLAFWKMCAPAKAVQEDDAKDQELARLRVQVAALSAELDRINAALAEVKAEREPPKET